MQSIEIAAKPRLVWVALTDASAGEKWRNANFNTDWLVGEHFEITANIGDKKYLDKGIVRIVDPPKTLEYGYWSSIGGLPDVPISYSIIRMTLEESDQGTLLTVEHQVPPSPVRRGKGWEIGPESAHKHVDFYWRMTLPVLKQAIERQC